MDALQMHAARKALRWSARELAERAGVSHRSVQRIENEGRFGVPAIGLAIKLALQSAGVDFSGDDVRIRDRAEVA